MRTMNALLAFPRLLPLALCLATACTSHEGKEPETETPTAKSVQLRATIAAVQLAQDCPDPVPAQAAAQEPARGAPITPPADNVQREKSAARMAPGAALPGSNWSPPCEQSAMQLTLSHDGENALPLEIKAVRLTAAGQGGVLATVPFRGPSKWSETPGLYEPWDQQLAPATELKTSYKLGEPDWGLVAKTLGSDDTFGKRYVLEVDVAFAGRSITVRSPEFERQHPHVIVT